MQLRSTSTTRLMHLRSRVAGARVTIALLILLIGGLYGILITTYLPPLNGVWSSDQGVKIIQLESLLLQKFTTNALVYPGVALDPTHQYSPLRGPYLNLDGQSYAMWSAAFAFLSSIPFFFVGYPGLYIIPIVATLGVLWTTAQIGRRHLRMGWTIAIVLICGLASPLVFYSLVFWEHTLAASVTLPAIWQAIQGLEQQKRRPAFIAGVLLGVAAWFRNEVVLAAPAFAIALLLLRAPCRGDYLAALAGGTVLGLMPLFIFNQYVYGMFVGPHILVAGSANAAGSQTVGAMLAARAAWVDLLLVPFAEPFLIAALLALLMLALLTPRLRHSTAQRMTVAAAMICALAALYIVTRFAVTLISPSLLLGFPATLLCFVPMANSRAPVDRSGEAPWLSLKRLTQLLLVFSALYIALALALHIPDGGAQWGPRVLLPVVPLLTLAGVARVASWFRPDTHPVTRAAVVAALLVVVGVSAVSEAYGIRQARASNAASHLVTTTVAQSEQRVVITDIWYAPPIIAPLFYDGHLVFLIGTGRELDGLLANLRSAGVSSFYYLGTQTDAVFASSDSGKTLIPIGAPQQLPLRLRGSAFQLAP